MAVSPTARVTPTVDMVRCDGASPNRDGSDIARQADTTAGTRRFIELYRRSTSRTSMRHPRPTTIHDTL